MTWNNGRRSVSFNVSDHSTMRKFIRFVRQPLIDFEYGLELEREMIMYSELYPADSLKNRRFYNVGAGLFRHPMWTNIDGGGEYYNELYKQKRKCDIWHDLFDRKHFPIDDNSAEIIYSSHTIEHIDNSSVDFFFKDAYRILKKNGILRITTMNIDPEYAAWKRNDKDYFYWIEWEFANKNFQRLGLTMPLRDASLTQIFLEDFASSASILSVEGGVKQLDDDELVGLFNEKSYADALDYCCNLCPVDLQRKYPFRHMNWFNESKLSAMLSEAGFKEVYRTARLQSAVPVLRSERFFDATLPPVSIYMEAVKK